MKRLAVGALAGAVSGAIVLGIGGRLAMRVVAVAAGYGGAFSFGGTIEIVLAAAVYGAIGGVALVALSPWLGVWGRGITAGLGIFALGLGVSQAARSAADTVPDQARRALVLFALLFLVYGVLTSLVAQRLGVFARAGRN